MFYHLITRKILIIKKINKMDNQTLHTKTHNCTYNGMDGVQMKDNKVI